MYDSHPELRHTQANFIHGWLWDGVKWVYDELQSSQTGPSGPAQPFPTGTQPLARPTCEGHSYQYDALAEPSHSQGYCCAGFAQGPDGICRPRSGTDLTPGFDTPAELVAKGSMHALMRPHEDRIPSMRDVRTRRCTKGYVLGIDGWCHPKGTISNKNRAWPKARRPLLTGGDLNCIAKASRAANRLKVASKRLKKLGMIKEAIR